MPLSAGVRLGAYEVLDPLGRGGMGEVYRARDTRLGRTVAIKILSTSLADDPESTERLRAEARAASLLTHPNICALHDIGHHDGIDFLVMELLQGETLAARLRRGPLPFEQVLLLAIDMTQALDAAHAQGIVHHDVKPSNVMLTPTGAKLLDFGVAKVRPPAIAGAAETSTLGAREAAEGAASGTLQYMAPEQIEGEDVDARADIFSLGAVLYEAATGRKAFEGKTRAALAGAILEREVPPLGGADSTFPPAFDQLIRRAVAKKPDERWQSSRDILFQLKSMSSEVRSMSMATAGSRAAWTIAGVASLIAVASAAVSWRNPAEPQRSGTFHIALPPASSIAPPEAVTSLALSPDGRHLAFVATHQGRNVLWVRPLDSLEARALPGTEDARVPFWSPDSRFIGFLASGRLQRVALTGGPPQLICEAPIDTTPAWGSTGTILFALTPDAAAKRSGGIYQVPADGGSITQVTTVDHSRGESEHFWPSFLPDGEHFIYLVTTSHPETGTRRRTAYIRSIDAGSVERVIDIDSRVVYVPSGHLLYAQDGALLARRFDIARRRFTSDPVTVAPRLWHYKPTGMAQFAVSNTGVLAYHGATHVSDLIWFDRSGRAGEKLAAQAAFTDVRISGDGQKIAVTIADARSGAADIWIYDRASGIPTRSTNASVDASRPVWSPDGEWLYFRSAGENGPPDIYRKRADGRGTTELTFALDGVQQPLDISPDGQTLVYQDSHRTTGRDILLLLLTGLPQPRPYLRTPAFEQDARVSPDGRWLAFVSSESGRGEVYVAPIDDPGGRQRVTAAGGVGPRWRRDGRELVYLDLDDTFKSVAIDVRQGRLLVGSARPLFSPGPVARNPGGGMGEPYYDLSPDGQSLLVNRIVSDPAIAPITVVLNWPAALQR
jgi:serine/threonine protein kinase